jgi:hypothetical protein
MALLWFTAKWVHFVVLYTRATDLVVKLGDSSLFIRLTKFMVAAGLALRIKPEKCDLPLFLKYTSFHIPDMDMN